MADDHATNAVVIVAEVMTAFASGAASVAERGQIFDEQATSLKFTKALFSETVKNLRDNRFKYDDWAANKTGEVDRLMVLKTAEKHGKFAAHHSPQQRITWAAVRETFVRAKDECQGFGPVCPLEL